MGISCTKLRFFGKKHVVLSYCNVCSSLCNVTDLVYKGSNKLCTLCNIEHERRILQGSDVFI